MGAEGRASARDVRVDRVLAEHDAQNEMLADMRHAEVGRLLAEMPVSELRATIRAAYEVLHERGGA